MPSGVEISTPEEACITSRPVTYTGGSARAWGNLTIGAVIDAYGAGEIELAAVHPETPKRHVYEVPGGAGTYTCLTVAQFLGWTVDQGQEPTRTCRIAFDAWHAQQTDAALSRDRPLIGSGNLPEALASARAWGEPHRVFAGKPGFTRLRARVGRTRRTLRLS